MTPPPADLAALLPEIPTRRMERRLVRCVPQLDFMASSRPTFLYTSGRPNRCNPAGVECLYFSETEATADSEYRRSWRGTPAEHQPKLTFSARVSFRHLVDLGNAKLLRILGLSPGDFEENWRLKSAPTGLQQLGRAISRQRSIAALRYPSAAALELGRRGWNVAIYPAALAPPDRVEILGNSPDPLEILP